MKSDDPGIKSRKEDHIRFSLEHDVQVKSITTWFEDFYFVPRSIPNIDFHEISLKTQFLGRTFDYPILIAGMTGGYKDAQRINLALAEVCDELNIPFGVGSQRAALEHPELNVTYDVKKEYPDIFLIGNLGLVQFSKEYTVSHAQQAIDLIGADALAIHVNAFQELAQLEGDTNFKNAWENLGAISKGVTKPVILKEVGCGIPWEDAVRAEELGVSAIDVGGAGGTSWAKLEILRTLETKTSEEVNWGADDLLLKWGLPTAISTYEVTSKVQVPVITTGGMYHGLLAAKAIAMGATMVGIARPILKALETSGVKGVKQFLQHYSEQIKRVMFLLGVKTISELQAMRNRLIPFGRAREWLQSRGFL